MPKKRATPERSRHRSKRLKRARPHRVTNVADWRRSVRPAILRRATVATTGLEWSPTLFATLLEELGETDGLEALLGPMPKNLAVVAYPQVIALALILRHSWQPHDLRRILETLEVIERKKRSARGVAERASGVLLLGRKEPARDDR